MTIGDLSLAGVIETDRSQLQVQKIVEVPQIEYEDQVVEIQQIKHVHVPWNHKGKLMLGRVKSRTLEWVCRASNLGSLVSTMKIAILCCLGVVPCKTQAA